MRTRLDLQKMEIDIPRPGDDPWINIQVSEFDLDDEGNIIALRDREYEVHRRFSVVATEMTTFFDPVTRQTHTLSVYGINKAITETVKVWLLQSIPSAFKEGEDIWLPHN